MLSVKRCSIEIGSTKQSLMNNFELFHAQSQDSASDVTSFFILPIRSELNILYGEELYVDYRSSYDFTDGRCTEKKFIQLIFCGFPETQCFRKLVHIEYFAGRIFAEME